MELELAAAETETTPLAHRYRDLRIRRHLPFLGERERGGSASSVSAEKRKKERVLRASKKGIICTPYLVWKGLSMGTNLAMTIGLFGKIS